MTISVANQADKNWVISLGERFDFGCVSDFRKCYESIPVRSQQKIIIDFRRTRYMDSSALGMLINAKAYLNAENSVVSLENCNDQIKKIFSISRFDKKFDIA